MSNANSSVTGKSGDAEQASAQSKDAVPRRRIKMQTVQNVLLIWLDGNIDDNSTDCCNAITQLRRAVNTINTFTDGEECIQFLDNMANNKACMIISGYLGQHILPRVHNMSQVDSIFILCGNKKRHEQWAKEWSKIKGVFTEIPSICAALKQAAQECEQNAISMSFVVTNDDVSKKNLNELNPSFMYTQILKEILLTIKFEQKHFKEFIDSCRDAFVGNISELNNVKKLEQTYGDETPIWWYTYECFLYPMLNRALRLTDADLIIQMGFFISDLHRHIEELHEEQFNGQHSGNSFTLYRGQGVSKTEFEEMTKTKGGLISFNSFLSTSKDCDVSLDFAYRAVRNPDLVGILFVMTTDPAKSTTPFASITNVSCCKDREDEVLFLMHTIFRICNITPIGENHRLFQVDLTLTSDNDKDLRVLTDRIRSETYPNQEGWYRLGSVLLTMGEFDKAQQVYEVLLEETTNENGKANIYYELGRTKFNQEEYNQAITYFEKSIEIRRKIIPPEHHNLANSNICLGSVYQELGQYQKALSFHEEALQIHEKTLPSNHPDLAISYNSIGAMYDEMGEYSKALSFYEKALEIWQQSLPSNHPDLAGSYNNIGLVYFNMGEYSKARSFYERALEIGQRSLPSNHPLMEIYRNNLEDVKQKL